MGEDSVVVAGLGRDLERYPGVVVLVLEEERGCIIFPYSFYRISSVVLDCPWFRSFSYRYLLLFGKLD